MKFVSHYTSRQLRVVLLTVALLCGLSAVFLKAASILPFEAECSATGILRTRLIPESVSLYAVQALVAQAEFQRAAGVRIVVEPIPDDPSAFRLTTFGFSETQVQDGFEEVIRFLKLKLKALAVSELKASQAFVKEMREEALEAERAVSETEDLTADPPVPARSTSEEEDRQRATLLHKEIDGLQGFLRYGKRPDWLSARLDRKTLERAEQRVETARRRLLSLGETWAPSSSAVTMQSRELQRSRKDLATLERHLAQALLKSHRVELEGLDAKSAAISRREATPKKQPSAAENTDEDEEQDWLAAHSRKLAERRRDLEAKANLSLVSGPQVQLSQALGYWVSTGLWTVCLLSLLGFLFVSPENDSGAAGAVAAELSLPQGLKVRSLAGAPLPSGQAASSGNHIGQMIQKELGRVPACLMVLGGDSAGRASLSLRLAQALSETTLKVRLIDFDLVERPLSQRFGEASTPGISDLLSSSGGGAPEEFFASLPGTNVEFASAGSLRVLSDSQPQAGWSAIFRQPNAVSLLDTSFASPIHLAIAQVDAVVCQYHPGTQWDARQSEVLDAIRAANLPIWGVTAGDSRVFRFL